MNRKSYIILPSGRITHNQLLKMKYIDDIETVVGDITSEITIEQGTAGFWVGKIVGKSFVTGQTKLDVARKVFAIAYIKDGQIKSVSNMGVVRIVDYKSLKPIKAKVKLIGDLSKPYDRYWSRLYNSFPNTITKRVRKLGLIKKIEIYSKYEWERNKYTSRYTEASALYDVKQQILSVRISDDGTNWDFLINIGHEYGHAVWDSFPIIRMLWSSLPRKELSSITKYSRDRLKESKISETFADAFIGFLIGASGFKDSFKEKAPEPWKFIKSIGKEEMDYGELGLTIEV